jgi:hypothetical protein
MENQAWDRNGRTSLQPKALRSIDHHQILQIRMVWLNVLGGDHDDSAQDLHTEQVASRDLAMHRLTRYSSFESHPSTAEREATTIPNGAWKKA